MSCSEGEGERINSFALVSYIPDPLGAFLSRLRTELVAGCFARSHVTILPPRALAVSAESAISALYYNLKDAIPFTLELSQVEVFKTSSVVYLGLGSGREHLIELHEELNRGSLSAVEPHQYHPHVTLAQDLKPEQVAGIFEKARQRWEEFSGSERFEVGALTFVQNTAANHWVDLEKFDLAIYAGR
jgi:2'-5' RNA ligase